MGKRKDASNAGWNAGYKPFSDVVHVIEPGAVMFDDLTVHRIAPRVAPKTLITCKDCGSVLHLRLGNVLRHLCSRPSHSLPR